MTDSVDILGLEMVEAKLSELKPYPNNPRRGNVAKIRESLRSHGQFKPLVVQRSTGFILIGNHTYQAMLAEKWSKGKVVYLDVDDSQAKKVMLADNRLSELGTYDSSVLAEVLKSIDSPVGTGYEPTDVSAIIAAVDERDADLVNRVIHEAAPRVVIDNSEFDQRELTFTERVDAADQRARDLFGEDYVPQQIEDAGARGEKTPEQKLFDLESKIHEKIVNFYEITSYWGIPPIRPDMLAELPSQIDTWAGDDVDTDDGVTTWLYNWGNGTTKGIPWERTIVGFYSNDAKWDSWYVTPHAYLAKVVSRGVKAAVAPDCSMWVDEPRFFHLRSQFRSNWLARTMQECGIRIIPTVSFCDLESVKIGVLGIPKNPPVVSVSFQHDKKLAVELDQPTGFRLWVEEIKPQSIIVYGGPPADQMVEMAKLPKELHIVRINNYTGKRRGVAFDKKEGLASQPKAKASKKSGDSEPEDGTLEVTAEE